MLVVFGRHHPPAFDEHVPLDRTRLVLAVVALAMFVLCFTPAPITSLDVISRRRQPDEVADPVAQSISHCRSRHHS